MFGYLVSKVYKLCVEAVLSDSYCYKPTCLISQRSSKHDTKITSCCLLTSSLTKSQMDGKSGKRISTNNILALRKPILEVFKDASRLG